jgi:molybdopterin-guanine dinucleotide biosynthesis protein A
MGAVAFGFVLVGGLSQRMGEDKTRLLYRGRPMALHQAEKLSFVCGRAALVGKGTHPFPSSGYRFVDDGAETFAPIYGVLAALSWSPDDLNVVVAADIPRCPESFFAALLEIAEAVPAAVVVPVIGGELQALCSVWRRSAIPALREAILADRLSLRGPIERLSAVIVPEDETVLMPGGRPENFLNVNGPEDYEELTKDDEALTSRR